MATWCDKRKPLHITPSAIHNTYTQSFHFDPYKDSLTPLSRHMSHGPAKTFTQELLHDDLHDFDDLSLSHPPAAKHHKEEGSNWESYLQRQAAVGMLNARTST